VKERQGERVKGEREGRWELQTSFMNGKGGGGMERKRKEAGIKCLDTKTLNPKPYRRESSASTLKP
jgi:hypothetical protein